MKTPKDNTRLRDHCACKGCGEIIPREDLLGFHMANYFRIMGYECHNCGHTEIPAGFMRRFNHFVDTSKNVLEKFDWKRLNVSMGTRISSSQSTAEMGIVL